MNLDNSTDLETLDIPVPGNRPVILSIGSCMFDTETQLPQELLKNVTRDFSLYETARSRSYFYTPVSLLHSIADGFSSTPETAKYHIDKKTGIFKEAAAFEEPIKVTLTRFADWLTGTGPKRLWANSPSFDFEILRRAFAFYNIPLPWSPFAERDYRTLIDVMDMKPKQVIPKYIKAHDAFHDAMWQAYVLQHALNQKTLHHLYEKTNDTNLNA